MKKVLAVLLNRETRTNPFMHIYYRLGFYALFDENRAHNVFQYLYEILYFKCIYDYLDWLSHERHGVSSRRLISPTTLLLV